MCYDISFRVKLDDLTKYFPELEADPQLKVPWPEYAHLQGPEILPKIPIIFRDKTDGVLRARVMEWGIIRHYEKIEPARKDRAYNLNIMSEKIFDPKSYWFKIKYNTCLIPLTGTYEHRGVLKFTKKVPYFIKPKNQSTFFIPGLYTSVDIVNADTGELQKKWTWGLITREPSPESVMRQIHNSSDRGYRMALYEPFELAKDFVSENLTDEKYKEILNYEMKSEDLEYYPTDTIRTAKPRADGKEKFEPFEWAKLPPLGKGNPIPKVK